MFLFLFINHIFHIHIFPISRESDQDWGVFILIQSNLYIKSTEWNWILCSLWTVICMYPLRQVWLYLYLILNIVMMINVKYSFLITGSWEESFKKQFTSFCPVPTLNCISTWRVHLHINQSSLPNLVPFAEQLFRKNTKSENNIQQQLRAKLRMLLTKYF